MDHPTDGDNYLVIAAVDLHPRMDKDEVPEAEPSFEMPTDTITARLNVHLVRNLPQFWTVTFPQVVRQHTLGVLGYLVWVLFIICSSFRGWKNFENRLRSDKVITINWVVHFFGTQCRWNSTGCRRRLCLRTAMSYDLLTCLMCKYIRDPILVKIFTKIVYSPGFRVIAYCNLDLWPFDPKS